MDIAFDLAASVLPVDPEKITHQMFVFWAILTFGGSLLYLSFCYVSYRIFFVLGKRSFFPKTIDPECAVELKRQMRHEVWIALASIPFMACLMLPAAVFSHRGYSKIYFEITEETGGWREIVFSTFIFFAFTDCLVYIFHRGLHHPIIYKHVHKLHHTYKYTTPFSSHAFNPCDGFGQGVSYYLITFIYPIHHIQFIVLFTFVNFWTISIHDQVDFGGHFLNTTGHHTIHHEKFNYDYGQYSTLWDRLGGTYYPAEQTHRLSSLFYLTDPKYVDPIYEHYHEEKGYLAGRFKKEAEMQRQKSE